MNTYICRVCGTPMQFTTEYDYVGHVNCMRYVGFKKCEHVTPILYAKDWDILREATPEEAQKAEEAWQEEIRVRDTLSFEEGKKKGAEALNELLESLPQSTRDWVEWRNKRNGPTNSRIVADMIDKIHVKHGYMTGFKQGLEEALLEYRRTC